MEKKSLKECYTNYFGAGNPEAKYWFLGFEPGGDINKDPNYKQAVEQYSNAEFIKMSENYYKEMVTSGVYNQIYQLVTALEENLKTDLNAICNHQDKKYLTIYNESKIFFTNLFLLKFKKENDPGNYDNLELYRKYFSDIKVTEPERSILYKAEENIENNWLRIRSKKNKIKSYLADPKLIFILKKNYETFYKKFLNLSNLEEVPYKDGWEKYGMSYIKTDGKHILIYLKNSNDNQNFNQEIVKYILTNSKSILSKEKI